jgi:Arc/MetJ family transcription regulator
MKRTNIEVDESLVAETMRLTGIKTMKGVVEFTLQEFLRREKQLEILKFKGKIHWSGDLDASRT